MLGEGLFGSALFAWWLYSFGFSEKAKAFFAWRGSNGSAPPA